MANGNTRKAEAKKVQDQIRDTKVELGQSLTARLQLLLSGILPAHLAPKHGSDDADLAGAGA